MKNQRHTTGKLDLALEHHRAGRFDQADALYQKMPSNPDALHLRGVLAHQQGRYDDARTLIEQAISLSPANAAYYFSIEHAYRALNRLGDAEASYRNLLAIEPRNTVAHTNLGNLLKAQNRFDEAVISYQAALKLDPSYAIAHSNLGSAFAAQGHAEEAIACYEKALALKPDFVEGYYNLAGVLKSQKKLDEAVAAYRRALSLRPNFIDAHTNLGSTLMEQHKLDEAVTSFRQAIALKPDSAEAYNNLGNALKKQDKLDEAIASYRQALAYKPDYAEAHNNLGNVFAERKQLDDAVVCYRQAIRLKPDLVKAYGHLGEALVEQGNFDEALICFQHAVELAPNDAETRVQLGNGFRAQKKFDEAVRCYLDAIVMKPGYAEAYNNLGTVYSDQEKWEEAFQNYQKAIEFNPDLANAYSNLGYLLLIQGKPDEAIPHYQKAIALNITDQVTAHGNLGVALQRQGDINAAINQFSKVITLDSNSHAAFDNLLLAMQYSAKHTPEDVHAAHVTFADQFEAPLRESWSAHINSRIPQKRLKIGYVSPDFRKHSVAYFIEPILAQHDRTQVEVFCYYSSTQVDPVTQRLQQLADHWIPCKYLSDDQLAERIRADGIDILVDLAGHTGDNRLLVFARKPAPVQVTWLGYPGTTGLQAIDYRITDVHAEPQGMTDHLNTEKLWRLPNAPFCYRAHDNSPDVIDHPPFQDTGFITFGSFNNYSKITDPVLALWARILQRLPQARLMLEIRGLEDAGFYAKVVERLTQSGLPLDRLILEPRKPENQYALYNRIDIALDPFPCNGGTTSLDTLWMGVPFITLPGRHFTSRMGLTILTNAGLEELIAHSEDEYVDKAVQLASDTARLTAMRDGLRQRVQASPLMDSPRFTKQLEHAYRGMWQQWCDPAQTASEDINRQGYALLAEGRMEEAQAEFHQTLAHFPDNAYAHHGLGVALQHQGRLDEAARSYEAALARDPDLPEAHHNLGLIIAGTGEHEQARQHYLRALALKPDFAEAYNSLGNVLRELGEYDAAHGHFMQALSLKADFPAAHNNLGMLFSAQGKVQEAIASYETALGINPDFPLAHGNLLLAMQYSSSHTPEQIYAAHVRYGQQFEAPLRWQWQPHANLRDPGKRLKIGYVSPDFRNHPVALFIAPVLAQHDHAQVEVFCYYNSNVPDATTQQIQAFADHWIPCKSFSDAQLAERIRADGIDILIDLAGHTANNRLLTFARKPAPVQVSYLGYIATTGLASIDYRITDALADPPGMTEQFHTERLCRMPDALFCYQPIDGSPDVIDRPPLQDKGYLTFGCLNNFSKISAPALTLWGKLLQRVPDARLLLIVPGAEHEARRSEVEAQLASLGLPPERLILLPRQSHHDYLATYNAIDIALDPFPFNGGTTSLDTLWMGVPFITLAGQRFISRMGVSILASAGLPELIAPTEDDYLDIAAKLANDIPRLTAMRDGLRQRVQASPLMDAPRFTRNIELAYRSMWQQWCVQAPETPDAAAISRDGYALLAQGKTVEAVALFRYALTLFPDDAYAHYELGVALQHEGNLQEALSCYEQALARVPDMAEAYHNIGLILVKLDEKGQALAFYRKAIELKPDFPEAYSNLGNVLRELGDHEAAFSSFMKALSLKVDYVDAHSNLGLLFSEQGKFQEAITCYETALALNPDLVVAHGNLAHALEEQGKIEEAQAHYRKALALQPDHLPTLRNFGALLHRLGNTDDAIACYEKALAIQPDYLDAHTNLLLALQYSSSHTPEQVHAAHVRFGQQFEPPLHAFLAPHVNLPAAGKRLKIGYVSPDFRKHSVAFFIEPVLAQHNRTQVEVFCYYNNNVADVVMQRIERLADHWIPCHHLNDRELAERIRADGIDILVDLAGHTDGNRLLTFARKPAPVQVTWLGYPATTGLTTIDYRLTDMHAEPPGMTEQLNVEKLWRLPDIFCCYRAHDSSPDVVVRPPLQDNGYVTFGCFNNFAKVTDPTLRLWAHILRRVPGSRLTLEIAGIDDPACRAAVETRLASLNLPLDRLLLIPRSPQNQYVLYNRIDIALDPFPCNGGTTSLDTLWMGVPFVTLAGRHFTSRMGVTILTNAGLPELIAHTEEEYVNKAVALATDIPRLTAMRNGLRQRVQASPLMDSPRFTQQLERAYRGMWQAWCATQTVSGETDPALLDLAKQHHRTGRLEEAVALYRKFPQHPDALYLRGVIALQSQQAEEALDLIGKAILLKPGQTSFYPAFEQAGRALGPEKMIAAYRQLLAQAPGNAIAHNNLGNILGETGFVDEALASYLNAIELAPDFAEAHANLGVAYGRQERREESLAHLQRAVALKPDFAPVYQDIGTMQARLGRIDDAIASFRKKLALAPDADAWYALGRVLATQGNQQQAIDAYKAALALQPDLFKAYVDLGIAYLAVNRIDEAIAAYRSALAIKPDYPEAINNLGVIYHAQGQPDEAITCYHHALQYKPDYQDAHDNLLLMMQYSPSITPEDMAAAHVRFGQQFESALRSTWQPHANPREPGRRLKIGYVSPDFRKHAVAYFVEPVLANHDRTQVEVFCYYNNNHIDNITHSLQKLADHWVPCALMSDEQLAERIRADGIDILIDLAGHTSSNRLLAFARKPAPVQVTWLGYPATTGLTAIDYRITDVHAEPPGMTEALNTEQLWRLPDAPFCYRAHDGSPEAIDHPPLQDNGYITFGCFNNFSKVTDQVLLLWKQILEQVPHSRLMLEIARLDHAGFRTEVETRLVNLGLPMDRLLLIPRSPQNQYVLYNRIDIALDPFPCNGGTTSLDTLWMGVPFVTLAGRHFTSRMGVTILTNAGLPELIAHTEEEYVNKAVALATDIPRLTAMRNGLRQRVQASPLMDGPRFTKEMENAYRGMWQAWCTRKDLAA